MYECRVTIEPVFDERLIEAKEIAKKFNFKVASLLMVKEGGELEPSRNDTFMTGHSEIYDWIDARMQLLVDALKRHEFKVLRYKIEKIIIDSKYQNDPLGLL